MSDLSPRARDLIDAARPGEAPTVAVRARVRDALRARLGAPVPAATATPFWVAIAVVPAVCAGVLAIAFARSPRAPAPAPRAPVAAPRIERVATVPAAPPPAVLAAPIALPAPTLSVAAAAPREVSAPRGRRAHAPVAPDDTGLNDELRTLTAAREALHAADPGRALALLAALAQRRPRARLDEERDVLRIEALCGLGRDAEARAEAEAFVRAHARSLFEPRIRATCPRER